MKQALLAGGCFWCIEAVFAQIKGVRKVVSGYTGGPLQSPSYNEVCSGRTGHAEAILVDFDPSVISYRILLEIFFAIHDPTTLNRQGADVGTQYRSGIYYYDADQLETAKSVINELQAHLDTQIVTEVLPAAAFYEAEDYHQGYFLENQSQPYCSVVITPKFLKAKKQFAEYWQD